MKLRGGKFYWAYGANLNLRTMHKRCHGAIQVKPLALPSGTLVFRGVADVLFKEDCTVHGGLWYIKKDHEHMLDAYEGVGVGLYEKCYLKFKFKNSSKVHSCLYYQMDQAIKGIMPPSDKYLDVIAQGYRDFGLPMDALDQALHEAWTDKEVTEELRQRRKRRGDNLAKSRIT